MQPKSKVLCRISVDLCDEACFGAKSVWDMDDAFQARKAGDLYDPLLAEDRRALTLLNLNFTSNS